MKYCPACNFTFPDFHRVCDFDGTELAPDPPRLPKAADARRSRLRRVVTSPALLTTLAVLAVFLSAVAISLKLPAPTIPVVKQTPPSRGIAPAPASASPQLGDGSDSPTTSTRRDVVRLNNSTRSASASRGHRATSSGMARLRQRTSTDDSSRSATIARQANREQRSKEENDPKLVAILKTTWNVLKKPFKF